MKIGEKKLFLSSLDKKHKLGGLHQRILKNPEDEHTEVWKEIVGFEGWYEISSFGRIRSLDRYVNGENCKIFKKGKYLGSHINRKGYNDVCLCNNGYRKTVRIHRLVAEAFIDNPLNLPQVNHINGKKLDNRVSNLEWCDNSYNQIHAYRNGLQNNPKARVVNQIDIDSGEVMQTYESANQAAIKNGHKSSGRARISAVCRGEKLSAFGYRWQYAD